jgi:hypothetical protein
MTRRPAALGRAKRGSGDKAKPFQRRQPVDKRRTAKFRLTLQVEAGARNAGPDKIENGSEAWAARFRRAGPSDAAPRAFVSF